MESTNPSRMNDHQRKTLEKIYQKIFDLTAEKGPQLNEEGRLLCADAGVKPEDLLPRQLDYFKLNSKDPEEVAKIRYQHHQQKRQRKLTGIGRIIEQNALKKRNELEQADRDYHTNKEKPVSNMDLNMSIIPGHETQRPRTQGNNTQSLGMLLTSQMYKQKIGQIQGSPEGKKTGSLLTNKISFYSNNRTAISKGFSANTRVREKYNNQTVALTPGQFFHARHQRNNSLAQRSEGQHLGAPTYQTNIMVQATQSVPIASRSFKNYLSARERAVEIAKKRIDKYNDLAMKKIKNEKMAEQDAKNRQATYQHSQGKKQERLTTIKKLQKEEAKDIITAGMEGYKQHLIDQKEVKQTKKIQELEKSKELFQKVQFIHNEQNNDPVNKFGISQFEQRSTFSRTGNSALWNRNKSIAIENELDVNNQMNRLDEKLNRGFSNSIMYKQQVMSNTKKKLSAGPELEEINQKFEDDAFSKWSKFLMKQSQQKKYLDKKEKDEKAIKSMQKDKEMEKDLKIKVNIKHEKELFKEKCQKFNQQFKIIDQKVEIKEKRLVINQRKHKVINDLRFNDNREVNENLKGKMFQKSCEISEKHIGLSMMNQDRKMFKQAYNDKYRARLARENIEHKSQSVGGSMFFNNLQKQHLLTAAFAPDMVKLSKAQVAKLLKDKKQDD